MSKRALQMGALFLIAWVLVSQDRGEFRHRVLISGPAFQQMDWDDSHWDDSLNGSESRRDDVDDDVDIGVDDGSVRVRLAEARRLTRQERSRLRSQIREQLHQARQEVWRTKTNWRAEHANFRNARNRIREEIRSDIRESLRGGRNEIREFRNQARELRNEVRECLRQTVRNRSLDARSRPWDESEEEADDSD